MALLQYDQQEVAGDHELVNRHKQRHVANKRKGALMLCNLR